MCGIFGSVTTESLSEECLAKVQQVLGPRGPDGNGRLAWQHMERWVSMVHTRLSIFDLSDSGQQPMQNDFGQILVYNGEIYNWPELRDELNAMGHVFYTRTDSEVILAAYRQWGTDCVQRFNGMWAFAIYDPNTDSPGIFLSRDRLGIKPLYYSIPESEFYFSSELKPIFTSTGRQPKVNLEPLSEMLVLKQFAGQKTSIYEGIKELNGGFSAWYSIVKKTIRTWSYWTLPERNETDVSDSIALDQFAELIEDSVKLRMRADVPVALTLSGGVDSSCLAVAASNVGALPERAFTSAFPSRPEIDETAFARKVCNNLGIPHHEIDPQFSNIEAEVQDEIRRQELPFDGLSSVVSACVLKGVAREEIKVFLSGQGGDELFLGYERYYVPWLKSGGPIDRISRLFKSAKHSRLSWLELILFQIYFSSPKFRAYRHRRAAKGWLDDRLVALARHQSIPRLEQVEEVQHSEILRDQIPWLLRYNDRTSAGLGLEMRVPFLDYRMVEWAWNLPLKFKIRDGWTKWLLRKYLERHGLADIAWRTHKLGFNAPTDEWTLQMVDARRAALARAPAIGMLKDEAMIGTLPFMAYNLLELSLQMDWETVNLN